MKHTTKGKTHRRYCIRPRAVVLAILLVLLAICVRLITKSDNEINSNPGNDMLDLTGGTPAALTGNSPTPHISVKNPHASAFMSNYGFFTELEVDGSAADSYQAAEKIKFERDMPYARLEGVLSFRGDNLRTNAAYGTANVSEKTLTEVWRHETGSLPKGEGGSPPYSGTWTGSGWTGQPILVKWPEETKAIMNLNDTAKAKPDLVEVIYATMDGYIYFYDLETGSPTRNKLNLGIPFKGAGSLDPRGYPLLYIGSGDHYNEAGKESQAMIISLIDGEVLYTFGNQPDPYALRDWHAYDSAPLIDEETDTLIYPGENGILYRLKLNTEYDKNAGTITVSPTEMVKMRYSAERTLTNSNPFEVGYEGSAVGWNEYLYLADNAGLLQCININTMEPVWVQDIYDDVNATIAFEEDPENNTAYLYIGSTLDNTKDRDDKGIVRFFKIDALTGEILNQKEWTVFTTAGVTGGVMTSAVIGENKAEGFVFFSVASFGGDNRGTVYALDRDTFEEKWHYEMSAYSWSSPVVVYDSSGNGYFIECNYNGNIYFIDAVTGEHYFTFHIESNIEASPAVFDNMLVIGTRTAGIWGIRIE